MRKVILIIVILINMLIPINALEINKTVEYLSNGDYIETEIYYESVFWGKSSKSGTKTEKYKNASGEVMWTISVTGTFFYDGTNSSCTKATVNTTKLSDKWSLSNKKATKEGNKAIASVEATKISAGTSVTRTVTLSCSKKGILS